MERCRACARVSGRLFLSGDFHDDGDGDDGDCDDGDADGDDGDGDDGDATNQTLLSGWRMALRNGNVSQRFLDRSCHHQHHFITNTLFDRCHVRVFSHVSYFFREAILLQ